MKKNLTSLCLLTLASTILFCQNANAVLYLRSELIITGTNNLGTDASTGTAEGWGNTSPNITITNGTGSLDGTSLGLVASAGDKAWIGPTAILSTRNQFATNGQFNISNGEYTNYYSFLYRFNVGTDVSTTGQIIMRLNRSNSGTTTAQHWDLIAKNVSGQIQIGSAKAFGNITNFAAVNIGVGQTFFVVVRQHVITGAQNDVYDLWVNPPAPSFGVNEASLPPS